VKEMTTTHIVMQFTACDIVGDDDVLCLNIGENNAS